MEYIKKVKEDIEYTFSICKDIFYTMRLSASNIYEGLMGRLLYYDDCVIKDIDDYYLEELDEIIE